MRRRKGEGEHANRLATIADQPAITAAEALRRNYLNAICEGLPPDDMRDIVAVQREKAKAGDARAARMMLDVGMALAQGSEREPAAATVNVQNNITNQFIYVGTDGVRVGELEVQRNAVFMIAEAGPMKLDAMARAFHLLQTQVAEALRKSPWFSREADGYHLTSRAHADVLEQLRGA